MPSDFTAIQPGQEAPPWPSSSGDPREAGRRALLRSTAIQPGQELPPGSPSRVDPREARRQALLAEHGLMTEEDLSILLGVKIKTLRNRPTDELPSFVSVRGMRGRLFKRDSVEEFLNRKPKRRRKKSAVKIEATTLVR